MMKLAVIKKSYTNIIVVALLLLALAVMTIGFALYHQTLRISGSAIVYGNGKVFISNVAVGTLRNASATPSYTDTSVDFNLYFNSTNATSTTDYSASFQITVTNDSVFDYTWIVPGYTPTVYGTNVQKYYDTSQVSYTVSGINTGDTIPSKSSATYTVTFTFTSPDVNETVYEIDGDYHQVTTNTNTGSLMASAIVSSGDLRSPNTLCAYQIEVVNTFDTAKTITLSTADADKFLVADSSGATPFQLTVPANSSDTYTFYLKKATGAQYGIGTQRVDILMNDGSESSSANYVIALVDQNVFYPDTTAPYISNVSATILNAVGSVYVSWQGRDNVAIDHYTVIVFNSSGTQIKTQSTSDPTTNLTVTGLSDTNYYFTVVGYDTANPSNTASSQEISDATTSEGHACRTNEEFYDWHFSVTQRLSRLSSSNTADTVNRGDTFTTTLSAPDSDYSLPSSITVTMGGRTVSNAYSSSNGRVTISNVTGDIVISGEATYSGGCLAYGTKILMADGSYKNVEDVQYDDLICVYDHLHGKVIPVYPLWIEEGVQSDHYTRITFEDGTYIEVVNMHSFYDVDLNKYVTIMRDQEFKEGTRVYKINHHQELEVATVKSIEQIHESKMYTNILSPMYYNVIANSLITVDKFASIFNIYGFEENAVYSKKYFEIASGEKLPYELVKDYFPHYLYQGFNVQNGKQLLSNRDVNFLGEFIEANTIMPKMKDGRFCFVASIQLKDHMEKYEVLDGEKILMPDEGASYYIETSTGSKYAPGEEAVIGYNMHFIGIYE